MFWEKYMQFREKQEMFWLAHLVEFIKKNDVQYLSPQISWAVRLSAAVLTQVSLITQKYIHDIFKCGVLTISLEAKMPPAQQQDLISFSSRTSEYYMERGLFFPDI